MNEARVEEMENKIGNLKSNPFSPKGKEHKMTPNFKGTRTQIKDLPHNVVQLPEEELRIVTGGLISKGLGCNAPVMTALAGRTEYITGGDHDTDW
jgi:hypothetical protein